MRPRNIYIGAAAVVGIAAFAYVIAPTVQRLAFRPTTSTLPQGMLPQVETPPPQSDVPGAPTPLPIPTQPVVDTPAIKVIAEGLEVPWDIVFVSNGDLLVTERTGYLRRIGKTPWRISVPGVSHIGEGGLLGIALHPKFEQNGQIYLYITENAGAGTKNRIDRFVLKGQELTERQPILKDIPGAQYHDGGKIVFGKDGYLYVTTGDASKSSNAQDKNSLAGKILRMTEDGKPAPGNPFGTLVYSYGHRNPQGLTWDAQGRLWATEHGRSGVTTGMDEVNLIEPGNNYGWPTIEGDKKKDGLQTPIANSGPNETWAPGGIASLGGKLYFSGLRGESLYQATPDANGGLTLKAYLRGVYGRLRAVEVGPDGALYISTSNTDGRGNVRKGDDRIIRIEAERLTR